jgi:hypothetical protein
MEDSGSKPKYEWKNVRIGANPTTGVPYFERRRVRVVDSTHPPEQPPDMDTLPPLDPHGKDRDLQIPLPEPKEK